jgi:hypothetical protein
MGSGLEALRISELVNTVYESKKTKANISSILYVLYSTNLYMMKFNLIVFLILASIFACSKDSNSIPDCIQAKIDEMLPLSSVQLKAVYKTKIDGEYHYWFNTGAVTWDGAEYIYSENCENQCSYCGFCIKDECIDKYPEYGSEKWEIVWKP